jgi:DNA invertase Pin-like site-specific DNA recombinase
MSTPVAILVRVSTLQQETDRQVTELHEVAKANGWEVVDTFFEKGISRRAAARDRTGLHQVMELAAAGKIKKVLVHEVSRIGRPAILHPWIEDIHGHGVSLYWHAQRQETLLPNGKRNPGTGMMLAVLSEIAMVEVETLSERILSGLAEARRKGKTLGRPKGSTVPRDKFLTNHQDIVRLLREGHSVRHAATITGKGTSTVMRVRREMGRDAFVI